MTKEEYQIKKEDYRTSIEQQLSAKAGLDITVSLGPDQISVCISNYKRYGFEGSLKRNWETKTYDKVDYNIGTWGYLDPNETLAGLYIVFGALLSDKDLQKTILDAMIDLTAMAKELFND
jgi:hypothetical protein